MKDQFDLAVIGAGSAGFSAAITAAEQGARVALFGYGTIGGTCVNVGCLPSKTMIRATEVLHSASAASRFDGISATAQVTDWKALVGQKQALVDELRQAKYLDVLPQHEGVEYFEGEAQVLLATGRTPNVEGLGLEEAGIALNAQGGVKVDVQLRTSRPGYAWLDQIGCRCRVASLVGCAHYRTRGRGQYSDSGDCHLSKTDFG